MKRRYQIISMWTGFIHPVQYIHIRLVVLGPDLPERHAPAPPDDYHVLASPFASPFASLVATYYFPYDLRPVRFIFVPPGWFLQGADPDKDNRSRGDEIPQTNTHEPGFWMGESEVTNEEYALCVETGVCSPPALRASGPTNHFGDASANDHPVVGVTWFQAMGFCEWAGSRLPTEAEWEYAARGGTAIIYPWGDGAATCERANARLPGCESDGDTKPTGSYPLGASPDGFLDMAGNVREWTLDWYSPDAYLSTPAYMPTGPASGDKKVVRGGGFNDFKENLRTTARLGLPPDQDFDDVGFRCVPVTQSYATFCEPSYVPLCYDPDIPRDDEPCVPSQNVPGEEGVTILGFGCPLNQVVDFQFSTNGGGNTGYTAMVDNDAFTCGPLDDRPDIVDCTGPEQPMGRNVEITICAPGGSPTGEAVTTTAQNAASGITLASFNLSGVISLMRTTAPNCPDGYTYDPETGDCIMISERPPCEEGLIYDWNSGECVPDESQERCPPGYYFNTDINCCEPIQTDNFECQDGYFWHEKYEKCVPIDDNNCAFGTTYNGYGECIQDPYTPGPNDPPQGECPPGLFASCRKYL